MRNLIEHPITNEEIVACLRRVAKDLDATHADYIGYMDALILEKAAEIIDAKTTQRSSHQ